MNYNCMIKFFEKSLKYKILKKKEEQVALFRNHWEKNAYNVKILKYAVSINSVNTDFLFFNDLSYYASFL